MASPRCKLCTETPLLLPLFSGPVSSFFSANCQLPPGVFTAMTVASAAKPAAPSPVPKASQNVHKNFDSSTQQVPKTKPLPFWHFNKPVKHTKGVLLDSYCKTKHPSLKCWLPTPTLVQIVQHALCGVVHVCKLCHRVPIEAVLTSDSQNTTKKTQCRKRVIRTRCYHKLTRS